EAAASSEMGQILHLKRLLVTLKQQYEKSLHHVQIQLQAEQNQRVTLQKELEKVQDQLTESQKLHEEEAQSLRDQQNVLKELLKKAQEECNQLRHHSLPNATLSNLEASSQRIEHLEFMIPLLRNQTEEANLESERLRGELNEAQKKHRILEQELL